MVFDHNSNPKASQSMKLFFWAESSMGNQILMVPTPKEVKMF